MIIPNVDSICLSSYLKELSQFLGTRSIILVLDGAGWHKASKLEIPDNIKLFFLPPYSPELNPVERFWQHIKSNTIKNKIYENLANLEKETSTFLKGITREVTASVCAVNYL